MGAERRDQTTQKGFSKIRQQLAAAATYEPKRSISNKRLVGTIAALFFGLATIYTSIFYVPAFIDVGAILGYSDKNTKLPSFEQNTRNKTFLSNYSEMFKLRRGYLRSGQALRVDYALSPGQELNLRVERCEAPIFIEALFCMKIEGQEYEITNKIKGGRYFIVRNPGFYYFDEKVINADGSKVTDPYSVMWTRRHDSLEGILSASR